MRGSLAICGAVSIAYIHCFIVDIVEQMLLGNTLRNLAVYKVTQYQLYRDECFSFCLVTLF